MTRREFLSASTATAALVAAGCTEDGTPRPNVLVASHSSANPGSSDQPVADTRLYELRIYTPAKGKSEALHKRFRDHTCSIFERCGIENVAYWMPLDTSDERLHYFVRYPDVAAREAAWKKFLNDPEWKEAHKASEANGPLLAKPPESFLTVTTDYSPRIRKGGVSNGGVFELRTYTAPPGLLGDLDARFRDHTINLFSRHGMRNYGYWHRATGQPAADVTLHYVLIHASKAAADASFAAFRQDPEWVAAKAASEKKAGGSLTVPNGVQSLFLTPTDFSPTR
jgi:heme-degrading monooxygenase HmoA